MRNVKLKMAIFEAGLTQRELARRAGIAESFLSMAVNGSYIPNEQQKTRIANELGKSKAELFSNSAA